MLADIYLIGMVFACAYFSMYYVEHWFEVVVIVVLIAVWPFPAMILLCDFIRSLRE